VLNHPKAPFTALRAEISFSVAANQGFFERSFDTEIGLMFSAYSFWEYVIWKLVGH